MNVLNVTGTYDFSSSFQRKIIFLYWKDYDFHNIYQTVIQPRYFESGIHMDLIRLIDSYYKKYNNSPTLTTLIQEVKDMCESSKEKVNKVDDYIEELNHISKLRSAMRKDKQYISDKVLDFGKRQAMAEAILDSAQIVNGKSAGDLQDIEEKVKTALRVGDDVADLGLIYFDTPEKMKKRIQESDRKIMTIPTGIDGVDNMLKGGIARGELCVVIAPPNRGKTTSVINMGAGAIKAGFNVVHLSFEMDQDKVAARYDSHFLGKKHEDILNHSDLSAQNIFDLHGKGIPRQEYEQDPKEDEQIKWGQLIIKGYPSGTCTIQMIKSYLQQLKAVLDFEPDVIIIDYPDIMKSSAKRNEKRDELNDLYVACRALGSKEQFNCAVIAASQTNRSSFDKKTVKANDIADDFSKVMTADEVLSFSQTAREHRLGEFRFYVAKAREMPAGLVIPCSINYDTKIIKSTSNAEYDDEDDEDEDDNEDKRKRARKYAKKAQEKEKEQKEVHNSVVSKLAEFRKKKEGKDKK